MSAVVVDEAYIEFSDQSSAIELLDTYPNLLVLRTLSKALGFAGARCGAVAGSVDVISMLNAVQAPYALATPVVECVEDTLCDEQLAIASESVAAVTSERARVMSSIASLNFISNVWPSEANFFLIRANDALAVVAHCKARKVLLRHFGGTLSDCIRITVGSRQDNDALLAALSSFAKECA